MSSVFQHHEIPSGTEWRTSLLDRYRVTDGRNFRLRDFDPTDCAPDLVDRLHSKMLLKRGVKRLGQLHDLLFMQDRWALLWVLQAMDAAGKDGTIKHVLTGVNPQGIRISSFKGPSSQELAHDFLWRIHRETPPRGSIGIFNRSHYEEVLVVRVHPEILARERLPAAVRGEHFWHDRLRDIAHFEKYLARQGTAVVKVFLNVSRDEQKARLLSRLTHPEKNWKFAGNDLRERAYWDAYQAAYEEAIIATAAPEAPWFIIPADHKWFARLLAVEMLIEALEALDLQLPDVDEDRRSELEEARRQLETEI
jgi:PPK2 family polyphosphate:nucleotide phosphotransferase